MSGAQTPPIAVRIEPLGETVHPARGEPLMRAAQRSGLVWPTICQGQALCAQCWVRVIEGADTLPPPGPKEQRALKSVPAHLRGPDVRLGCQIMPTASLRVERSQIARAIGSQDPAASTRTA